MIDADELKVLISYKDLQELLSAVSEIPKLRKDLERCHAQVVALKGSYVEVLDRIGDLMRLI